MAIRCTSCQHRILEEELPLLDESTSILCPECGEKIGLPEMTMPISLASAQIVREMAERQRAKKYALLVLEGAETGNVYDLTKKETTIGRSDCDVVLDDPEISRRHARVVLESGVAVLEDLGSTNGTFVGKERVKRADLEDRSRFRVGSHELAFVVSDREP
jgi:DNA-directed RNA polymerase subunit RPC12/RpoP